MDAESAVDALQWLDWYVSTTYLQRKEEMGSDVNGRPAELIRVDCRFAPTVSISVYAVAVARVARGVGAVAPHDATMATAGCFPRPFRCVEHDTRSQCEASSVDDGSGGSDRDVCRTTWGSERLLVPSVTVA
jgi:hypothetical protein